TTNPEDYTARGKIITPLKDRIDAEIRTHYPDAVETGMEITRQEAWTAREGVCVEIPDFVAETVERVAFLAREDKRIDQRSGVSQRLPITVTESIVSNAERRALRLGQDRARADPGGGAAHLPRPRRRRRRGGHRRVLRAGRRAPDGRGLLGGR